MPRKTQKPKLTLSQRNAIKRAIYLLKVAAFTDLVNEDATAPYDETTCDGYCFKDDSKDAAENLEFFFGPFKMPVDTPKDEYADDDEDWN